MRLSDAQVGMLADLSDFTGLTEMEMMIYCGKQWRKTADTLINRGLATYQPYAFSRQGAYKITAAGRDTVQELIKQNRIVRKEPPR